MNIDTSLNKFADMAQKMGMGVDITQKKQTAQLARLKIQHSPIMGEVEVKGKKTQAAIVNGGSYRIDDLASESKPAGFVKDYQALPVKTKELLKSIKRVRVLIGTLSAGSVLNADGNDVMEIGDLPFIWEVDNRDAFKIMGEPISKIGGRKHLPVQYKIKLGSEQRKLPNGNAYYLPTATLQDEVLEVEDSTQDHFSDFMQWIENYNSYIFNAWNDKAKPEELSKSDKDVVSELVDVDDEVPF